MTRDGALALGEAVGERLERRALAVLGVATALVLAVLFYYPVLTVFADALRTGGEWTLGVVRAVFTDPFYFGVLAPLFEGDLAGVGEVAESTPLGLFGFTAYQAALSTVASVLLGLPGAYVLSRYEFPGRRTIRSLTIVPFVLPSIMVAIGFYAFFGTNGLFNDLLAVLGIGRVTVLGTLEAIVVAHAFYNAPLVARVTTAAWESVDARTVETARSLGANPYRAFVDVLAPQLLPAVLTGALLTFVFTFMSFPIVLALGGFELATVEVWIYALVQQLDYAEAATLAVVETAISLGLTYAYLRYEARQAGGRAANPPARKRLLPDDFSPFAALERAGVVAYALVVAVVFLGPLLSMVTESLTGPQGFTLRYYEFLVERQATGADFQTKPGVAVRNSLLFGAATLLVALPMGVTISVLTTRGRRGSKLADAAAMAPLAVSGVVVGLGMLRGLVFGVELWGHRIQVAGTSAIVAAHAVAAYPFVVRNVSPLLASVDRSMVESARALGATRVRALLDVELPLVASGVAAGAAFAFAISIGEFDSTVILATGSSSYTMPVAVERYIGNRTLGPATAMGTVLLAVTSLSFVVIDRLGGRWEA
ncbi:iron ABC transporter permease [Halorussus salilacus]|uniref:ABC transporter permease n=1 Tax=Halorussus salilacus TaxID=2953750 RepID=UPI00209CD192|nr:iron ABC transporter permease [Halorussus salilacus]USZ67054.1 iron ABC transporter permease [Halorussus salilacus]